MQIRIRRFSLMQIRIRRFSLSGNDPDPPHHCFMKISHQDDNLIVICSLLSIYQQRCARRQQDHHTPISRYYERLNAVQARGSQASHQVSQPFSFPPSADFQLNPLKCSL
jgi:hypothetical protein